jgi:hypothetical protein
MTSLTEPRGYKSTKQIYNKQWNWTINSFLREKILRTDEFIAEFYNTLKEELIPRCLQLFHEIERERNFQAHAMVSITLIP